VPGLLAGLLVFSLMHRLDQRLQHWRIVSKRNGRLLALGLLGAIGLLLAGGLTLGVLAAWKARTTALPELLPRMAHVIDSTRTWLGDRWIPEELADADSLRDAFTEALQSYAAQIKTAGSHAGRTLAHILAGLAIGVLASFHHAASGGPKPLAAALGGRLKRLLTSFEAVVYAQIKISLLNTGLSIVFLYVALPLFHVHLPLRFTLVIVTFICGLLPVLGNLFSNTAIIVISLGAGPSVAVASLVYLVVIHKLEYFFNARIVGERIHSQAWEVLLAMIVMEVAFGTPGLVLAPVLYAYIKQELRDREWV
jgi:predicted PurR-regulated permease PerM